MFSLPRQNRTAASNRLRPARLRMEPLEDRTVPTLSDPFQLPGDAIPAVAAGAQELPEIARGGNGSLVVWADTRSVLAGSFSGAGAGPFTGPGLGTMNDIFAARLDADGNVVDTSPLVVS